MPIKILLADDHALTRVGIRNTLEAEPAIQVIAEAENGREALRLAKEIKPDIVILDIYMPELNGIDAAVQILQDLPDTKIIFLSMHAEKNYVEKALKTGASGYVLKDCAIEEIVLAVKDVYVGKCYLSSEIVGIVVHSLRHPGSQSGPLTSREREVLQMVAEGKTNKEIAAIIHVSVKTVESYRSQIMEKLNLRSVAELTKYAVREGITPL